MVFPDVGVLVLWRDVVVSGIMLDRGSVLEGSVVSSEELSEVVFCVAMSSVVVAVVRLEESEYVSGIVVEFVEMDETVVLALGIVACWDVVVFGDKALVAMAVNVGKTVTIAMEKWPQKKTDQSGAGVRTLIFI